MTQRLILSVILVGLFALVLFAMRRRALHRASRGVAALPGYQKGRPAVVYFYTRECPPCILQQRPALERLQQRYGDRLQMMPIDAEEHPHLADQWGVLGVPTTFLVDQEGRVRGVNSTAIGAEALAAQLAALGAPPPERPVGTPRAALTPRVE